MISVDGDVRKIWNMEIETHDGAKLSFDKFVRQLRNLYANDTREFTPVGKRCKGCPFGYASRKETGLPLKNGFQECWRHAFGENFDFSRDTVLDIWNFRKADDLIADGKIHLEDLDEGDVVDKGSDAQLRQWTQVRKVQEKDDTPEIDRDGLASAMATWKYPLHFIDFETSMAALPFNHGRRPYELTAFQFSHHVMQADGQVSHAGQWLAESGYFPNFDFVRALKRELENDGGTIFRYAAHENTVLNQIYDQLSASDEPDRAALMRWIKTVTIRREGGKVLWQGRRNMVDMLELVKKYHYDPHTHGSNSIKAVLPAIIHASAALRRKYGKPVYGTKEYPSLNHSADWAWIRKECGNNPYKALPSLFTAEVDQLLAEEYERMEDIANGGAALAAYAKLQFEEITPTARRELRNGLLRYCELDTFAMVMLCEYWKDESEL